MKRLALLALGLALGGASEPTRAAALAPYLERPPVRAFIHQMVERHGFDARALREVFAQARVLPQVRRAIESPAQPSWQAYQAEFVSERRIDEGLEFWDANRAALGRADRDYGVPAEVIVAIIGVESYYGKRTGRWRVLDALATLAFDGSRRAGFFRDELESYLLLAREAGLDLFALRGSAAGAIGLPQFMPHAVRQYGLDFDGDGKIDLLGSAADAIGSVANFLRSHGWRRSEPVELAASVRGAAYQSYLDGDLRPRYPLGRLAQAGIAFADAGVPAEARAALIELATPDRPSEFRIGLHNFYVLTRYNRSAYYACAVGDLAEALRGAR